MVFLNYFRHVQLSSSHAIFTNISKRTAYFTGGETSGLPHVTIYYFVPIVSFLKQIIGNWGFIGRFEAFHSLFMNLCYNKLTETKLLLGQAMQKVVFANSRST